MDQARANLVFNERVKLIAGFANALAIGIIGIAVFKPMAESEPVSWWAICGWSLMGLAIHTLSHYILGHLRTEGDHASIL